MQRLIFEFGHARLLMIPTFRRAASQRHGLRSGPARWTPPRQRSMPFSATWSRRPARTSRPASVMATIRDRAGRAPADDRRAMHERHARRRRARAAHVEEGRVAHERPRLLRLRGREQRAAVHRRRHASAPSASSSVRDRPFAVDGILREEPQQRVARGTARVAWPCSGEPDREREQRSRDPAIETPPTPRMPA